MEQTLKKIRNYLPSQAPLKDFVHHNTLHAFQQLDFFNAVRKVHTLFGYKTILTPSEYLALFREGKINEPILLNTITELKGEDSVQHWYRLLMQSDSFTQECKPLVGRIRPTWKSVYKIDLEGMVNTTLFRLLNSYLDQGIAIWKFPLTDKGFLPALRELDKETPGLVFKTGKAKQLFHSNASIREVLKLTVGDERYFENYLFDQQFSHPGWSGMVAVLEDKPHALINKRTIRFDELVLLECLLELDALETVLKGKWQPLAAHLDGLPMDLDVPVAESVEDELAEIWQTAYEWTYYDEVLKGLQSNAPKKNDTAFQAFFCMDDRECSIRRNLEYVAPEVETFGTPGHFNLDIYFQQEKAVLYTKCCPAPMTPKFLIKEISKDKKKQSDIHYSKRSHGLVQGWIYTHTVGFWSGVKLMLNVFHPTENASSVSSFNHMNPKSKLTILHDNDWKEEDGLQVGYTIEQAAERIAGVLESTGCVSGFSRIIYIVGHGSSSSNNTHYAGYNCGACSGRPGSVNARAFSALANMKEVRDQLKNRHGIVIPEETVFIGALHDTARDDMQFFDTDKLTEAQKKEHGQYQGLFLKALDLTAKERSRRFMSIDTKRKASDVHKDVRTRTVSLFEPRPELNHSNNTVTIIGPRRLSRGLFLDRRSFLNSYDCKLDPEGKALAGILGAAHPVVGGINLEYYFSRVDNDNFGAGTKLPHNVMGLIGVANGVDSDLRTGLPSQMIEVHDPLRMLVIIEQKPEIVLSVLENNPHLFEWYRNDWMQLVVLDPDDRTCLRFKGGEFAAYTPVHAETEVISDLAPVIESSHENLPVFQLS